MLDQNFTTTQSFQGDTKFHSDHTQWNPGSTFFYQASYRVASQGFTVSQIYFYQKIGRTLVRNIQNRRLKKVSCPSQKYSVSHYLIPLSLLHSLSRSSLPRQYSFAICEWVPMLCSVRAPALRGWTLLSSKRRHRYLEALGGTQRHTNKEIAQACIRKVD
jgi:hypothetical protein